MQCPCVERDGLKKKKKKNKKPESLPVIKIYCTGLCDSTPTLPVA